MSETFQIKRRIGGVDAPPTPVDPAGTLVTYCPGGAGATGKPRLWVSDGLAWRLLTDGWPNHVDLSAHDAEANIGAAATAYGTLPESPVFALWNGDTYVLTDPVNPGVAGSWEVITQETFREQADFSGDLDTLVDPGTYYIFSCTNGPYATAAGMLMVSMRNNRAAGAMILLGQGGQCWYRQRSSSTWSPLWIKLHETRLDFETVTELLADTRDYTSPDVTVGDICFCREFGDSFTVADSSASDHQKITAGGVKLYISNPSDFQASAFNPPTDGSDAATELQEALDFWRETLQGGTPSRLHISGEYLTNTALTCVFDAASSARGVLDMAGGCIQSGISNTTLLRVAANAAVENITLNHLHLDGLATAVDVLLEIDGSGVNLGHSMRNVSILNPRLKGGKIPLWIRNNAHEISIEGLNAECAAEVGNYGVCFDLNFDAVTPDGANGGTVTGSYPYGITFSGGAIKGGEYGVNERASAVTSFFGVSFSESLKNAYKGPAATVAGGLYGCYFEDAWNVPDWAATTAYVVGDLVQNDSGKVYTCVTPGTSAGSGGPTGTGAGIADGSVEWDYVSVRSVIWQDGWAAQADNSYTQLFGHANTFLEHLSTRYEKINEVKIGFVAGGATVNKYHHRNTSDNGGHVVLPGSFRGAVTLASSTVVTLRTLEFEQVGRGQLPGNLAVNTQIDLALGNSFEFTATGNLQISTTTPYNGDTLYVTVVQDAIGGRAVTFDPGRFKTIIGTVDTTANTITTYSFVCTGFWWRQTGLVTGVT